ncbi:5'-nucleotidase [Jannaschia faecimaris]|uniref:5'-nucleotidase n=1 Tax=Jannaschia faecimaris TaxID=1244108 RepID=A0A1H3SDA7_9RHOB|nr:metallophosphoesterase [Jannaschia faecimaris]SDZ35982.1 5'-nucleotidase [Jannaschia faecimaris]
MRIRTAAAVVALLLSMVEAHADYSLTILHTNDFHSSFEGIDRWDHDCPAEENAAGNCYGGSARLMTAINEARKRTENSVLFDAGDQFPRPENPYDLNVSLTANLMNRLAYDAMTLGNHEFDYGEDVVVEFIDRLNFPVLVANIDFSGNPHLALGTRKSAIIERGGEKLGLIGVTLESSTASAAYAEDVVTFDATGAVQAEVDNLIAEGVNKIIVISHLGYSADKRLAESIVGIDVIVGGHTHSYLSNTFANAVGPYPTMVNGVAVVQTFSFGLFLGELTATFDDEGNLTKAVGDPILLDASVAESEGITSLISNAEAELK